MFKVKTLVGTHAAVNGNILLVVGPRTPPPQPLAVLLAISACLQNSIIETACLEHYRN